MGIDYVRHQTPRSLPVWPHRDRDWPAQVRPLPTRRSTRAPSVLSPLGERTILDLHTLYNTHEYIRATSRKCC